LGTFLNLAEKSVIIVFVFAEFVEVEAGFGRLVCEEIDDDISERCL
jgi:hypothetical protein